MAVDKTQWRLTPIGEVLEDSEIFYVTSGQVHVIGRSADVEFSIATSSLSRKHAEIELVDDKLRIKDLGSANGTFINDKRITETFALAGDIVRFKPLTFKVEAPFVETPSVEASTIILDKTAFISQEMLDEKTALLKNTPSTPIKVAEKKSLGTSDTMKRAQLVKDLGSTGIREALHLLTEYQTLKKQNKIPSFLLQLSIFCLLLAVLFMSAPEAWKQPIYDMKNEMHNKAIALNAPEKIEQVTTSALFPTIVLTNNSPLTSALLFDVNDDKNLDIVTINQEGEIRSFDGGNGKELKQIEKPGVYMATAAVMTYKDQESIVIAQQENNISILGKDLKELATIHQPELKNILFQVLATDVNGDKVDDIIITDQYKGVSAFDGARTGWALWRISDQLKGNLSAPPLFFQLNNMINFVISTDTGQTQSFNIIDGQPKLIWSQQATSITFASPVAIGNKASPLIAIITDNDTVVAMQAQTGALKWQQTLSDKSFITPITFDADKDGFIDIITFSKNGTITAFKGDSGKKIWKAQISGELFSTPATFDINADLINDLVVLSNDGHVSFLSGYDGSHLTEELLPVQSTQFILTPLLGDINNDGMLDIVTISQNNTINIFSSNRPIKTASIIWPQQGGKQVSILP